MSWGFAFRLRRQKLVLATFVGTLTFSFSLLRHVEQGSVPNIGGPPVVPGDRFIPSG